jgi:ABC-type dipeptide/oligopeptide/nickel transport system permease component
MGYFIGVRLIRIIITMFLLITVVYVTMFFAPSDPVYNIAGPGSSEAFRASIRKQYGLDQPLHIQYFRFLGNLLHGDFGISWRTGRPVKGELLTAIPHTVALATLAMVVGTLLGLTTGILSATHHNRGLDKSSMVAAIVGISTPIFVLNLGAIFVFAYVLGWFPTSGAESISSWVLPATSLGVYAGAMIARMVRSAMLEMLRQDFVRAARAKGLHERVVIYKHVLRNAMIPIVTIIGIQFGVLLGGSVITETVFAWPGLGQMIITAIKFGDTPLAQAGIIFFAGGFLLVNLIVDLCYNYLDPRLRANLKG